MSRPNDPFNSFGHSSFNDSFNASFRTAKRVGGAIGCLWVLCVLGGLGLLGALIYVAVHFLAKVW